VNLHERVRADLDAGRAWKARDRLEGALANAPTDQSILETLAKICFELGDLPAAGKYWYLTDATGDDVERALAAFGERHPTPKAVFTAFPMKAPPDAYPRTHEHDSSSCSQTRRQRGPGAGSSKLSAVHAALPLKPRQSRIGSRLRPPSPSSPA
jgi:hypothetical protein